MIGYARMRELTMAHLLERTSHDDMFRLERAQIKVDI